MTLIIGGSVDADQQGFARAQPLVTRLESDGTPVPNHTIDFHVDGGIAGAGKTNTAAARS